LLTWNLCSFHKDNIIQDGFSDPQLKEGTNDFLRNKKIQVL
jgi:hypothetical protein